MKQLAMNIKLATGKNLVLNATLHYILDPNGSWMMPHLVSVSNCTESDAVYI